MFFARLPGSEEKERTLWCAELSLYHAAKLQGILASTCNGPCSGPGLAVEDWFRAERLESADQATHRIVRDGFIGGNQHEVFFDCLRNQQTVKWVAVDGRQLPDPIGVIPSDR